MYNYLILPSRGLAEIVFCILVNRCKDGFGLLANLQLKLRDVFGVKWEFLLFAWNKLMFLAN